MTSDSNATVNRTHPDPGAVMGEFFVLDPIVYAVFCLLTAIGSFLIFWLFCTNTKLRSITGYLMIFITIIDSCTSLFILLPSVYTTISRTVPWEGTVLCTLQSYSNMFLQNFKANLIMLCALDRAYSLLRPFVYQRVASKKVLAGCITFIVLISLVMPSYLWGHLGWKGSSSGSPMCWPTLEDESAMIVYWTSIVLDLVCPGIVVVICYGLIVVIVVKQRKAINEQKQMMRMATITITCDMPSETGKRVPSEETNSKIAATITAIKDSNITNTGLDWIQHLAACKMLFLVTLLYFLAHVPIFVADHFFAGNAILTTTCNYLAYLSTWMNFIIYYNTDSCFKNAAKALFKKLSSTKLLLHLKNANSNNNCGPLSTVSAL